MNKAVSTIGGLLVIGVAVVFIVQFQQVTPGQQKGGGPKCAIEIQGSCIPASHFWASYRLISAGLPAENRKSLGLRKVVADGLIERWLLNEDAKRLGITVSDEDLTEQLRHGRAYVSIPADRERDAVWFQLGLFGRGGRSHTPIRDVPVRSEKTKAFEMKTYERNVRTYTNLAPTDFRELQRMELLASRMREIVRSRVQVAESEVFDDYSRRNSTVLLQQASFSKRFYKDVAVDKSEKAVEAWATNNKDEIDRAWEARKSMYEGECRVTRHVLALVQDNTDDAAKEKAKKRIDKALALINSGTDFGEVARRLSQDGSASEGGALGCVPKKQMVKPFEDATFALEEGKVSGVVTTEYGFHVVKVEKIYKAADVEKAVRAQIAREQYIDHEADRLAAEAAKTVLAAMKSGKPLEEAVKTHLDELRQKLATASEGDKDKKDDKKADDKKDEDKKDADKKDEDKKEDKKADDDIIENVLPSIDTHADRPLPQDTPRFNVSGNPLPDAQSASELVKAAFALQKTGDVLQDVIPLHAGYAVAVLKDKTPAKQEDWEKDRDAEMQKVRRNKQSEALILYVQRLRSKSGMEIKQNESIVSEPVDPKGSASGEPPMPEDDGE